MRHSGNVLRFSVCTGVVLALAASSLWAADAPVGIVAIGQPANAAADTNLWEGDPWQKPDLIVGDPAPSIDVKHWIQDGEGAFKPVTEFEADHVYVIEFWATWCGPCIASMPHLSELQKKYADKGLQIISISDEQATDVRSFLHRPVGEDVDQTFADVTAAYCLTTDPDRSAHKDYMEAALQGGIPTSFLVGKDGKVEWIGHPGAIDEALEQVVAGTWDREAFKALFDGPQRLTGARMQVLARAQSDVQAAEAMIDDLIATAPDETLKQAAEALRGEIGVSAFHQYVGTDQAKAAEMFPGLAEQGRGQPFYLANLVVAIERHIAAGNEVIPGLYEPALEAVDEAIPATEGFEKEVYRCLRVRLLQAKGDIEQAIEEEQALLDEAQAPEKQAEYQGVLDQLKEVQRKASDEAEDGEG